MLMAVMFARGKGSEIVLVGDNKTAAAQSFIDLINKSFLPYSVVVVKNIDKDEILKNLIPYTEGQNMVDNKATAYVCENFACRAPITDIDKFMEVLN
jgi:uncharacterized protein YyaL (SSP411 family)